MTYNSDLLDQWKYTERKMIFSGDVFMIPWRGITYPGAKVLVPAVQTWYIFILFIQISYHA